jgi:glycogen operon protein
MVLNGRRADAEVTLPDVVGVPAYRLLWDSTWERPLAEPADHAPGPLTVPGTSMRVYGALPVG